MKATKKLKDNKVKSKRLILIPKTLEEMQMVYEHEQDSEMKQAYLEMIEEMKKNPDNQIWATDWDINLLGGEHIGGIAFKGKPNERGEVEVGYGIDEAYRGQGYATEAVAAMLEWALAQEGVACVQAQTKEWNEISQKVLRNNHFKAAGQGQEGPLFEVRKPRA